MSRHTCLVCRKDVSVRPVVMEVKHPVRAKAEAGEKVKKRVHMKPMQFLVSVRLEGSPGEQRRWRDLPQPEEMPFVSVCSDCLDGRNLSELLRIFLDRVEEEFEVMRRTFRRNEE